MQAEVTILMPRPAHIPAIYGGNKALMPEDSK
jgi:hypothetical protein